MTKWVELIGKKEFTIAALDLENELFVIHIVSINLDLDMHPFQKAHMDLLKIDKTSTVVFSKYIDFAKVFSKNLTAKL